MNDELFITSIKEINKKRRLIYINYEPAFPLYTSEIWKYKIKENDVLSLDSYNEIIEVVLKKRARLRALNLLKVKDYTEKELERKLKENYYPDIIVEDAINYVKNYLYIDDERYTENFIEYKSNNKSIKQIIQLLVNKGVEKELIEKKVNEYMENNENYELDMLINQIRKLTKYNFSELTYEDKNKIYAKFYRKGFSVDFIKKALDIVAEESYNN